MTCYLTQKSKEKKKITTKKDETNKKQIIELNNQSKVNYFPPDKKRKLQL